MIALFVSVLLVQEPEKVLESKRCMECHEGPAEDWKTSVHAAKNQGCTDCHGTDSVDVKKKGSPHLYTAEFRKGWKMVEKVKWTDSPNLCKGCHVGVSEAFEKSQHFNEWKDFDGDLGSRSFKGCLACHDYHATKTPQRGEILKSAEMGCAKCHKAKTKQITAMTSYVALADGLERALAEVGKATQEAIPGLSWAAERAARERGLQKLQEIRTGQHHADFDVLKKFEEEVPPVAGAAHEAAKGVEPRKRALASQKKVGLGAFLGLMAVTLLLTRAWCLRAFGRHGGL